MSRQTGKTDSIALFIADWRRERPDLDPWPLGIIGGLLIGGTIYAVRWNRRRNA